MRKHWRFLTLIATLLMIGIFIVVAETQTTSITQSVGLGLLGGSTPASPNYRWKDVSAGLTGTTGIGAVGLYLYSPSDVAWKAAAYSTGSGLLVDVYQVRRFPQSHTALGEDTFTLLSAAVVAPTVGPDTLIVTALGTTRFITSKHSWQIVVTGAPANVTVNLEGSIDGTNWFILDTSNITTSELRHVVNKPVKLVRANLTQLVGGVVPTVTVISLHGGN